MLLSVHAIWGSASAPSLSSMESEWILGRWRGRGAHFHWHTLMDKTDDRVHLSP
jgi:hypothetical protein